jgi:hypothetical protein
MNTLSRFFSISNQHKAVAVLMSAARMAIIADARHGGSFPE